MSQFPAIMFLLVFAVVGMTSGVAVRGDDPPWKITTKRADDSVEINVQEGKTVLSIHSPFGISHAVIQRNRSDWPTTVTLRLHLQGLEHLQITHGKSKLEAAVASQDTKVRLWKDGQADSPLDSKHPYWMEIRSLDKDGKPAHTIPLNDGYFEAQIPPAVFADNPKSITLHWTDFYR